MSMPWRKRVRLVLGGQQTMTLLAALSYAIDTFQSEDEEDNDLYRYNVARIREFEAVRDKVRKAYHEAHR